MGCHHAADQLLHDTRLRGGLASAGSEQALEHVALDLFEGRSLFGGVEDAGGGLLECRGIREQRALLAQRREDAAVTEEGVGVKIVERRECEMKL